LPEHLAGLAIQRDDELLGSDAALAAAVVKGTGVAVATDDQQVVGKDGRTGWAVVVVVRKRGGPANRSIEADPGRAMSSEVDEDGRVGDDRGRCGVSVLGVNPGGPGDGQQAVVGSKEPGSSVQLQQQELELRVLVGFRGGQPDRVVGDDRRRPAATRQWSPPEDIEAFVPSQGDVAGGIGVSCSAGAEELWPVGGWQWGRGWRCGERGGSNPGDCGDGHQGPDELSPFLVHRVTCVGWLLPSCHFRLDVAPVTTGHLRLSVEWCLGVGSS